MFLWLIFYQSVFSKEKLQKRVSGTIVDFSLLVIDGNVENVVHKLNNLGVGFFPNAIVRKSI